MLRKIVVCVFLVVSINFLFSILHVELKPQFTAVNEEVGVYFGYDGNTVSDKYKHSEMVQVFSLEGSIGGNRLYVKWFFTSTQGFGLGSADNDFQKYWHEANYRIIKREWYDVYLYHSFFRKNHDVAYEVEYTALNSKYLVGVGVRTKPEFSMANINFTDFSIGGAYGIIYMGGGNYKNEVWIPASNPYSPYSGSWKFEASESFGIVFFMDMGLIWSPNWGYAATKLKVGGFLSGSSETNGYSNDGEMVNGTISFQSAAGLKLTKNIDIGTEFIIADENCRNESDDQDGSHFTSTIFNLFINLNYRF
ncbi:MAG: hypothetical protein K9N09_07960 [Candidatus Cloacimonetes bacterium]|nr:hypothetical protein [Candidatus Cloacimonadota bacterium]MCF7813990.1 hypothetical protein [Candidatus Cloacimonadota bacterium]MCF7868618.1 hypothetical protein [Candidatus Cloacimonadota bacterium]MCF7882847.1 hypothetical protein [Candidatus Cloacimonadota bacterium]